MSSLEEMVMENFSRNCSSVYYSESYVAVAAVSAGLAFLSTLLIMSVIAIIILFKKWRFFSQRLILYLAVSAILVNAGIILHRVDYHNQKSAFYLRFCQFGGYLDQTSNWMLLNSVSAIITYSSFTLFLEKRTEKYEPLYFIFIFVFPLFVTWVPFIKSAYGRSGAWCWIRFEDRDTCEKFIFGAWLQYFIWFVPLYATMVVLIILYAMILARLHCRRKYWTNANDKTSRVNIRKDLLPLIAYPLIYFLFNIFPLMNRTYNTFSEEPNLVLWFLVALANPSIGALIALAFTLDPGTRKRLTLTKLHAAAADLCRESTVKEYGIEDNCKTDSYHSRTDGHPKGPYKNFEDCYQLNLGSTRSL